MNKTNLPVDGATSEAKEVRRMSKTHGCCETQVAHVSAHGCCCHGPTRHFITKAERREGLEAYREQLQHELTGVEEHLADLGE